MFLWWRLFFVACCGTYTSESQNEVWKLGNGLEKSMHEDGQNRFESDETRTWNMFPSERETFLIQLKELKGRQYKCLEGWDRLFIVLIQIAGIILRSEHASCTFTPKTTWPDSTSLSRSQFTFIITTDSITHFRTSPAEPSVHDLTFTENTCLLYTSPSPRD